MSNLGCDLSGFVHKSVGSLRSMVLLLGETILEDILGEVVGPYGLMFDDVTDIANVEQMIGFIQYYSKSTDTVLVKFLCIKNVLAISDSPDAETITNIILDVITQNNLDFALFKSFVSDGASVMVGHRSGVATRLKSHDQISSLISVHCVCHKLALACTDTLAELKGIQQAQNSLNTLWRMLDNSNKKVAIFMKVQLEINNIILTNKSRKKVAKKLKKSCCHSIVL